LARIYLESIPATFHDINNAIILNFIGTAVYNLRSLSEKTKGNKDNLGQSISFLWMFLSLVFDDEEPLLPGGK